MASLTPCPACILVLMVSIAMPPEYTLKTPAPEAHSAWPSTVLLKDGSDMTEGCAGRVDALDAGLG